MELENFDYKSRREFVCFLELHTVFVACPVLLCSKPYTYIIKHPAVVSGFSHIFNPTVTNLFI